MRSGTTDARNLLLGYTVSPTWGAATQRDRMFDRKVLGGGHSMIFRCVSSGTDPSTVSFLTSSDLRSSASQSDGLRDRLIF